MIELHLDLKLHMKPWKKALAFSFIFYLIILVMSIIIITFAEGKFNRGLELVLSTVYLTALILIFRYMYKTFKEKSSISLNPSLQNKETIVKRKL
jgi:membrane protease YdiL (CAAX protease family)